MTTSTTRPIDWHRQPKGIAGPCAVCALPPGRALRREHRAVAPDENRLAQWLYRVKGPTGWKVLPVFVRRKRSKLPRGAKLPKAKEYRWHQNRTGTAGPCPLCGFPRGAESHRAVAPIERSPAKWRVLRYTANGRPYTKPIIGRRPSMFGPKSLTAAPPRKRRPRPLLEPAPVPAQAVPIPSPDTITLDAFFETTYLPVRLVGKSSGTVENYRAALKHWKRFTPNPPIRQIDGRLLASFQAALLQTGVAPATVNGYTRPLKAMLRLAADEEYAVIVRVPKLRLLREPKRVPLALTVEEFGKVLVQSQQVQGMIGWHPAAVWWRAVLLTAWETGLRYKALLALRTIDFLPDSGGLHCQAETQKTKEAQWFALSATTIAAIQAIVRPHEPLLFHPGVVSETVGEWLRQILDRSGIYAPQGSGQRWHRLRRSKASYTAAAGGDAQRALAHSAASVTAKYLDPRIAKPPRQPPMPLPEIALAQAVPGPEDGNAQLT
jgi:integrase